MHLNFTRWNRDGTRIVSTSYDTPARIWNIKAAETSLQSIDFKKLLELASAAADAAAESEGEHEGDESGEGDFSEGDESGGGESGAGDASDGHESSEAENTSEEEEPAAAAAAAAPRQLSQEELRAARMAYFDKQMKKKP